MRILAVAMLVLGCSGLATPTRPDRTERADLLVLRDDCQFERVTLPGGETRPIAKIPSCSHGWGVLSPEGTRALFSQAEVEVVLATGEIRELPPVDIPDPSDMKRLDYDAKGVPLWYVDEQTYVLRQDKWVEEPAKRSGFMLHSFAEISDPVEVTDAALRQELQEVSGSTYPRWQVREPVAWTLHDEGEAGWVSKEPVLLRVGGRWKKLPSLESYQVALEVHGGWLLMSHHPTQIEVVELSTGEVAWSGKAKAAFWPASLPLP